MYKLYRVLCNDRYVLFIMTEHVVGTSVSHNARVLLIASVLHFVVARKLRFRESSGVFGGLYSIFAEDLYLFSPLV